MKMIIAAVGQKMPGWVSEGYSEYARRFPPHMPLLLKEIPLARRTRGSNTALIEQEAESLAQAAGSAIRVVLDEQGKCWSTADLARQLEGWQQSGRDVAFLVGGPEGHHESTLKQSEARWSLGRLTLPHPMVRVVLAEALYRAWSVTCGHPYHRE